MAPGAGSVIQFLLWAPARSGEMNGPSRCTPSTRAPGTRPAYSACPAYPAYPARWACSRASGAARRRALASCATGAVMNVGMNAVVPVSGSRAAIIRHSSGRTASSSAPKYPFT